jgi:hypothetical protein
MNATAAAVSTPASPRFVDNADGTVTDNTTGLMWSKATLSAENVTHRQAENICTDLDLAGHKDWRLPTVGELFALADHSRYSPAIDTEAFPGTHSDWYWSSTITAWSSDLAWVVCFSYGNAVSSRRDYYNAFVRAVRASPSGQ